MTKNTTAYYGGLRFAKKTELAGREREDLAAWAKGWRLRISFSRNAGNAVLGAAAVSAAAFIALEVLSRDKYLSLVALCLAVPVILPALAGSLIEIYPGYRPGYRALFGAAAVLGLAGAGLGAAGIQGTLVELVQSVPAIVCLFGGWGAIVARWRDARRLYPRIAAMGEDAANGNVLEFSIPEEFLQEGNSGLRVDVLASSGVIWRVNGTVVRELEVHPVAISEIDPEAEKNVVWAPAGFEHNGSPVYQRYMTEEERGALEMVKKQMAGAAIKTTGWAFWVSLLLFRGGEMLMDLRLKSGISALSWACAAAVGVFFFVRKMLERRKLCQDMEAGLFYRLPDEKSREVVFLPRSGILWSIGGAPAPWRTL